MGEFISQSSTSQLRNWICTRILTDYFFYFNFCLIILKTLYILQIKEGLLIFLLNMIWTKFLSRFTLLKIFTLTKQFWYHSKIFSYMSHSDCSSKVKLNKSKGTNKCLWCKHQDPSPRKAGGLVVLNILSLDFVLKLRVTDLCLLFHIYPHSRNELKEKILWTKIK